MGLYLTDPELYKKYKDEVLKRSPSFQRSDKRAMSDKEIAAELGLEGRDVTSATATRSKCTRSRWTSSAPPRKTMPRNVCGRERCGRNTPAGSRVAEAGGVQGSRRLHCRRCAGRFNHLGAARAAALPTSRPWAQTTGRRSADERRNT